jgi:hypothetical protein
MSLDPSEKEPKRKRPAGIASPALHGLDPVPDLRAAVSPIRTAAGSWDSRRCPAPEEGGLTIDRLVSVKRVIVIPVIHTLADLGSLADSVRAHYVERFGPEVWQQRQRAVETLWDDIRRAIDALRLDCRRVRIYQDGLPVCGKEPQIVEELAGAGSLNHQIVLELMGQGAVLVGTEDPQLLLREYQLQRRTIGSGGTAPAPPPREAADLLAARDLFIAQRIAATLQDGETGLVFLGAAHRLDAIRSAGLDVLTLDRAG